MATNNQIVQSLNVIPISDDEVGEIAEISRADVLYPHPRNRVITQDHKVRIAIWGKGVALVDYVGGNACVIWTNLCDEDAEKVRSIVERRGRWIDAYPTFSQIASFLSD